MRLNHHIPQIEKQLNSPKFMNISMGETLESYLWNSYVLNDFDVNWYKGFADPIRLIYHRFFQIKKQTTRCDIPEYKDRILITWMSDTIRVNELVHPVIESFGLDECIILAGHSSVCRHIISPAKCIIWDEQMAFDFAEWKDNLKVCWQPWQQNLKRLGRKMKLPKEVVWRIQLKLLRQTRRVSGCVTLLKKISPKAIVTEFDRHDKWSCLISAAKVLGVPSFTLVHGGMHPSGSGYTPVLADKIFCWGESQRLSLIRAGVSADNIVITGCPRISSVVDASPVESREKVGLDLIMPVVLLATNPSPGKLQLAESFCSAIEEMKGVQGVIRLHPSEKLGDYEHIAEQYPDQVFMGNKEWSIDEALTAANIVVIYNSTFGREALVKKKTVVVYDIYNDPAFGRQDLVEEAGCPLAKSPNELKEIIHILLNNDKRKKNEIEKKAARYVEKFCKYYGNESARLIVNQVRKSMAMY